MKPFVVRLAAVAAADLDAITGKIRERVIADIKGLVTTPLPDGSSRKKLKGFKPPLYRLRSGDYRILYRIEPGAVIILRVINRKDLEKEISRFS